MKKFNIFFVLVKLTCVVFGLELGLDKSKPKCPLKIGHLELCVLSRSTRATLD